VGDALPGESEYLIDWAAYFYGGHAKSELALLKRMAVYLGAPTAKFTYLDIGTNVGQHVLFMSPLVDRVVGFEPVEHLRRQALDNLALRRIQNAEILGCALGEKAERRNIFINLGLNPGSSSLLADFSAENSRVGTSIGVVKGDEVIRDREIARVKIVKIDVEGFEPCVCRRLSETFNRDRPFVLIELALQYRRICGRRRLSRFYLSRRCCLRADR
jgi:FkbM family methyltransferase